MSDLDAKELACLTCGKDLHDEGQWLRCRVHFAADIRRLSTELADLKRANAEIAGERDNAVASEKQYAASVERMETQLATARAEIERLNAEAEETDRDPKNPRSRRAKRKVEQWDAMTAERDQLRALLGETRGWVLSSREILDDNNELDDDDRESVDDLIARIDAALGREVP